MLTHPTHERLITLGLTGMAKALQEQRRSPDLDALSFEERVGLLVDREAAERDTKRLTTRLKFAALRQSACVEDVDWRTPRGIDRSVFARLVGLGNHDQAGTPAKATAIAVEQKERMDRGRCADVCGDRTFRRLRHAPSATATSPRQHQGNPGPAAAPLAADPTLGLARLQAGRSASSTVCRRRVSQSRQQPVKRSP